MIRTVLADAGPLYAAIATRDEHYPRARAELSRLESERWTVIVISSTICEAYTLLMHRLGIRAALRWLRELTDGSQLLAPDHGDCLAAMALVARYPDQDISLFDALLAVVSRRLQAPVWTYDHHFDVMRTMVWR